MNRNNTSSVMEINYLKRRFWILAILLFSIGLDQLSKYAVRFYITPMDYIPLVEDFFILTNVENTGAMLGLGQNLAPWLKIIWLQLLPVVMLLLFLYNILKKEHLDSKVIFAFALVIGGGIGNLIDRIVYGSVTDFFQLKMGVLKTGIFNMADVAVTTGVLLIIMLSIRHKKMAF